MYTQFYGNFLLNENLITPEQLVDALQEKSNTRLKLGLLAINSGYMTSDQVDRVHEMQTRVDKRFGDISVELGYLTEEQVTELLKSQQTGFLLLGQALVDKNHLTNSMFQDSINAWKSKYSLSDEDLSDTTDEKTSLMIKAFISIAPGNQDLYSDYVELLIKNLIRFVGDDFTLLEPINYEEDNPEYVRVSQDIQGELNASTSLYASEDVMIQFASRFIQENLTEINEYTEAGACDFLNLNNGLFAVNMSNIKGIELKLTPPHFSGNHIEFPNKKVFILPVFFTFGTIKFLITL